MASVVPTVTAETIEEYNVQLGKVESFAKRIHFDFSDGVFAPTHLINLVQAHWPKEVLADLHLMFKDPTSQLETAISLKPNLVIIHAEASGGLAKMMTDLKAVDIKAGIALLPQTAVDSAKELIKLADHVLIFAGSLGYQGGTFDGDQLSKIALSKAINPLAEIAVDGGINNQNAAKIVTAGASILNVGSFIQKASSPEQAYMGLESLITQGALS